MTRPLEFALIPSIFNVTLTSPNTEFSQVLPIGTSRFLIHIRNAAANIKVAYVAGESGTNFITVLGGEKYEEQMIFSETNNAITLYFQTPNALSPIVEIVAWTTRPRF